MGEIPLTEGFYSHRIAERAPVSMSALTLFSRGNLINGVYNHNPPSKRNSISEELTSSGKNSISGDCLYYVGWM